MGNKILLACDSFKGSLTSRQVGEAAAAGIITVRPDLICDIIPVADGGEGTVEALVDALGGHLITVDASDPLGKPIKATYGLCGDIAVIEVAAASGLTLLPTETRNPSITTSFGTGELIADAISKGCRRFLIGLGGSATNDGGTGMLRALGFSFLDEAGKEVSNGGVETGRIVSIDTSGVFPELKECTFTVACDVNNPLTGANGASHVFGPQKGADKEMIEVLDSALAAFAHVTAAEFGRDLSSFHGAGAAGGLGFAFISFLGGTLKPGIDMVLEAVGFDDRLRDVALVITGEGRLDCQTCMGKTPYGVLSRARKAGTPVIAIGGGVEPEAVDSLIKAGFKAVFPVVAGPMSLAEALQPDVAARNVERTVAQIIRTLSIKIPS